MRIVLFFIVLEAALIMIVVDMVGRLRAGGTAATTGTPGDSALKFALETGVAALVVPIVGWLVVRGMR